MKTKLIAWYLPQYHIIPENDEFWGKGFTDWVTVKKAHPLFKDHQQPRVPLNNNYYDLSIKDNVVWQAKLAKEHGIYGFGIYHYWFNNEKNILTKPLNIIHDNQDIDIRYLLAWDNASWVRSWSGLEGNAWTPTEDKKNSQSKAVLIPYILGKEKDWENHYSHVSKYFKDKRYIKQNNRPVFIILQHDQDIIEMCSYWDILAKQDGFDGIHFIFKNKRWYNWKPNEYRFNYEPHHDSWMNPTAWERRIEKLKILLHLPSQKFCYNYDIIWKRILKEAENANPREYLGAFVGYDDTPRRSKQGKMIEGASPDKFKKYLGQLINISVKQNKEYIFITAWNEWGEGAFLEPDENEEYNYLNVIKELTK